MSITFPVEAVKRGQRKHQSATLASTLKKLVNRKIEAGGSNASDPFIAWGAHPLLGAVHLAYDGHYPLILRPDDVWLALTQGLALHIEANAEMLRKQFVSHEGQATLVVRRDAFVKGSSENNWPGAFSEFSDQIAAYIGKKRDLIVQLFSTTGPIERAASEIVLMDAMKSYFRYEVHTLCGIPEITLLGTPDDWKSIHRRVEVFTEFDLGWWTANILPVLDEFIAASEGSVNKDFWKFIYKDEHGSGNASITGWINTLFPYIQDWHTKQYTVRNVRMRDWRDGPANDKFPSGVSKVPFLWKYFEQQFEMEFLGGFVGVAQNEAGVIYPAIGWGVCDARDDE